MILVFKTSVKTKKKVTSLTPILNSLPQILNWNFDLDDCDDILRIDSETEISELVIKILHDNGIDCVELDD